MTETAYGCNDSRPYCLFWSRFKDFFNQNLVAVAVAVAVLKFLWCWYQVVLCFHKELRRRLHDYLWQVALASSYLVLFIRGHWNGSLRTIFTMWAFRDEQISLKLTALVHFITEASVLFSLDILLWTPRTVLEQKHIIYGNDQLLKNEVMAERFQTFQ